MKKASVTKIILNKPETGNTLVGFAKNCCVSWCADIDIKAQFTANGKLFCGGGNLKFLSKKQEVKNLVGNDNVWQSYQEWLVWVLL